MISQPDRCPDELVLAAYAERTLPPLKRGMVEAHLGHCDACRQAIQEARGFLLESVSPAVPAELVRVRQVVRVQLAQARRDAKAGPAQDRTWRFGHSPMRYAAAASLLMVLGLAYGFSNGWIESLPGRTGSLLPPKPAAAALTSPALRLERAVVAVADRLATPQGNLWEDKKQGSGDSGGVAAELRGHLTVACRALDARDAAVALSSFTAMEEAIDGADRNPIADPDLQKFLMNILIPAGEAACRIRGGDVEEAAGDLNSAGKSLAAMRKLTAAGGCYCLSSKAAFTLSDAEYRNLRGGIDEALAMCGRQGSHGR